MADATLARLPLHDRHVAAGARFAPFAGYEMPTRFTTIREEHMAVRTGAGIFDVSHMGEVFVRGADAVAAVDGLISNHLGALADGRALYTVMCRPDGGIVDDLIVYRFSAEEVLIVVNAANRAKDVAWIRDHIEGDVTVTDETDAWVQLAVQGPKARGIVAAAAGFDTNAIAPFAVQRGDVAGTPSIVARTGYTGEDGFELYLPAAGAGAVYDRLMDAADAHGGLASIGLGARDSLRLEARLMLYGNDIDETTNPYEAGLGWVVKLDAGPFIGRDALAAIKAEGPARRLRGLVLEGRGMLRTGYDVAIDGTVVGRVTSGSLGFCAGDVPIGLAYIDRAHTDAEQVDVLIRNRAVPARVTRKPFYRRAS